MRSFLKFCLILGLLAAAGYTAYDRGIGYLKERNRPEFRTAKVTEGSIAITVKASGQIKPVLTVQVGSFVSGPIIELLVEHNDMVEKDQLLARIDPRIYQAAYDADQASLQTARAEVQRIEAELQRARNDERRAMALKEENPRFISQAELDQRHFSRLGLEASLKISQAAVKQAEARAKNSEANLGYTNITAPVAGIVLDRKIDPGATLAAQFQTPELFEIAPDLRDTMHIHASVSEVDMGLIRQAHEADNPVHFEVEAYRGEVFKTGKIIQIRLSAQEEQNVVSYPVIVATPNPDLRLLPDMTASLTFQVSEKTDLVRVPQKALSFYPAKKEHVHPDDHDKLDLAALARKAEDDAQTPAEESADSGDTAKRHIWIQDGKLLRAVEIETGIYDLNWAEVVAGDLKPGDKVVTEVVSKSFTF